MLARAGAGRQCGAPARLRLLGRDRALHELLERYLELSASDQQVHTWPAS